MSGQGTLSVVATPIGNLEDITLRALRTMQQADAILAEDTRRSRKLCSHHDIHTRLRAFHAHSSERTLEQLVEELCQGAHFALVTDAGTPLISDPGLRLVQGARERGVRVECIPGPSAVTTALCVSAITFDEFRFMGFLARGGKRRKQQLQSLAQERGACVLFESPKRLRATLSQLSEVLGPLRQLCVCRELTKLHEQVIRGSADELLAHFSTEPKGEITLVVEGCGDAGAEGTLDPEAIDERISALLQQGEGPRDIADRLTRELGVARRTIYNRALSLRKGSGLA